jgi:Leucine-rich repeat (LRR) protein
MNYLDGNPMWLTNTTYKKIKKYHSIYSIYCCEHMSDYEVLTKFFNFLESSTKITESELTEIKENPNVCNFYPIYGEKDMKEMILSYNSLAKLANPDHYYLSSLYIENLGLKEFPIFLFQFKNLESLSLSRNPMKTIPRDIDELKSLRSLYLDDMALEFLPDELTNLKLIRFSVVNNPKLTFSDRVIKWIKSNLMINEFYYDGYTEEDYYDEVGYPE